MNCHEFHDRFYEYLDETLDTDVHAAFREHLRECADCQRALLREEATAKSIRKSLARATAELSLRPDTLRTVLRLAESESSPAGAWKRCWHWLRAVSLRPVGATAALLGVLLLGFGIRAYRHAGTISVARPLAQAAPHTCVVDVPMQFQIHLFRRENNTVVDAITPGVARGHARYP